MVTVEWLRIKQRWIVDYCNYLVARTHLANAEFVAPIEISVDDYLRQHPEKFKVVSVFTLPRSQEVVLLSVCDEHLARLFLESAQPAVELDVKCRHQAHVDEPDHK